MGLTITTVRLRDFRNYEEFELEPDPHLTVLVGKNAVGKTNLIEAVELLTAATSFRKPAWSEVIRQGASEARLEMLADDGTRRLDLELEVTQGGRRRYKVNGKPRPRIASVAGIVPCVLFTPDDLGLVKGSAEKRRAALDDLGVQLSPSYAQLRRDYERVLRQRNALLKEEAPKEEMEPWTQRLVELGASLTAHRMRLFERLRESMAELYEQLSSGGSLGSEYLPSWQRDGIRAPSDDPERAMRDHLKERGAAEAARRSTISGPHRDDLAFVVEGRDARIFGSQGQQRTVALAWKLAEVAVIADIAGNRPVLLLDDVMSELDEGRRRSLAGFVGSAAQTIVTTTNLGYFEEELLERAKVVVLS